jgi:DNA-binding MarR family transcriptional regulator
VTELAELARVRKQTMAEAVDQLERMGYVERRPNPRDRRSRLVFLTERGASVKPVTHATAARVEERWAELTSREELEALRASLLHLLTQLRNPAGPA